MKPEKKRRRVASRIQEEKSTAELSNVARALTDIADGKHFAKAVKARSEATKLCMERAEKLLGEEMNEDNYLLLNSMFADSSKVRIEFDALPDKRALNWLTKRMLGPQDPRAVITNEHTATWLQHTPSQFLNLSAPSITSARSHSVATVPSTPSYLETPLFTFASDEITNDIDDSLK